MEWFWRSKCGVYLSTLAVNVAPQSMPSKGSLRKNSRYRRSCQYFTENDIENSTWHSSSSNNVNGQNRKSINEEYIKFHIPDQIHLKEIKKNIISAHSAPPRVQQQISNQYQKHNSIKILCV